MSGTTQLEDSGCPSGDNLRDAAWTFSGKRLALGNSGVRGMTVARPLLEHAIRRRVARLPNVHIRAGLRVKGLLHEAGRVTGVRIAVPGGEEKLTADLGSRWSSSPIPASRAAALRSRWTRSAGLSLSMRWAESGQRSIRRHYEQMRNFPEGLVVCADALASFNPTFGQGITVAALQAVLLRDVCASVPFAQLGKVFLRRAAPIVDVAWSASVGRTFLYAGVVGRPMLKMRIANAYLPHLVARAHQDPDVATAFLEVLHFLAPPAELFAPRTMLRVLASQRGSPAVLSELARSTLPID